MKNLFFILFFTALLHASSDIHECAKAASSLGRTPPQKVIPVSVDVALQHEDPDATVIRTRPTHEALLEKIGQYKILAKIGEGGEGKIYQAQDEAGNHVIVKVAKNNQGIEHNTFLWGLRTEAEMQNKAYAEQEKRPDGLKVFIEIKLHEDEKWGPHFAIPFVAARPGSAIPAPSLLEILKDAKGQSISMDAARRVHEALGGKTGLTQTQKEQLWAQYTEALNILNAAGLVHGDLKPGNMLVYQDGVNPDGSVKLSLKIIDFGYSEESGKIPSHCDEHTPWGTPAYMHPQHWVSPNSRHVNDYFASDVIYQQLMLGRDLWRADTFDRKIGRIRYPVFKTIRLKDISDPKLLEHSIANTLGLGETLQERIELDRLSRLEDKTQFYQAVKKKLQEIRQRPANEDFSPHKEIARLILSHEGMIQAQAQGKLFTDKAEVYDLVRGVMELTAEIVPLDSRDTFTFHMPNPTLLVDEFIKECYRPAVKAGKIPGKPEFYTKSPTVLLHLKKFRVFSVWSWWPHQRYQPQ